MKRSVGSRQNVLGRSGRKESRQQKLKLRIRQKSRWTGCWQRVIIGHKAAHIEVFVSERRFAAGLFFYDGVAFRRAT